MKTITTAKATRMSADEYAGFLKLWLTPSARISPHTPEVEAYLAYVARHDPLSDATRRAAGLTTGRAA